MLSYQYIQVFCIEGHICPVLFSPTFESKLKTGQFQNKFLITVLIRKSIHQKLKKKRWGKKNPVYSFIAYLWKWTGEIVNAWWTVHVLSFLGHLLCRFPGTLKITSQEGLVREGAIECHGSSPQPSKSYCR